MSDMMQFPETVEEFMEQYKMVDRKEVYSNGTEYVPIFRMKQWFEHETAKRKLPKWIPVSEKLPWTDTDVLVTVLDDSGDTPWSYTSIGWLTPKGEYWVVDNEMCYGVVAWMPLPSPYRTEMKK